MSVSTSPGVMCDATSLMSWLRLVSVASQRAESDASCSGRNKTARVIPVRVFNAAIPARVIPQPPAVYAAKDN